MIAKNLFDASKSEYKLWEDDEGSTVIHYYPAKEKKGDAAIVIFAGGGYHHRAVHEGEGYARHFAEIGIDSFVVDYRVCPNYFPLPLLDARRGVRFVRYYSEQFGINPEKIGVMGSSAGGHLSALVSSYKDAIDGEGIDEIDNVCARPNSQILCYPVISMDSAIVHTGSMKNLLGPEGAELAPSVSPDLLADGDTPDAFIWHTSSDNTVNVINSYMLASALRRNNVAVEMHIFPEGKHGLGLAEHMPDTVGQWVGLMDNWLRTKGWVK